MQKNPNFNIKFSNWFLGGIVFTTYDLVDVYFWNIQKDTAPPKVRPPVVGQVRHCSKDRPEEEHIRNTSNRDIPKFLPKSQL